MTEAVLCALCGYEGSAHEVGSHSCIAGTLVKIESAEDDAKRLAEVAGHAVALLHDRTPHSKTCTYIRPGVCSCGLFSLTGNIGKALRLHQELT